MAGRRGRLVQRILSRLQSTEYGAEPVGVSSVDVAAAQARVRRLHALSDQFRHVQVSRSIAEQAMAVSV